MAEPTIRNYFKKHIALISVILLISTGHLLAITMKSVNNSWFIVVGFYGLWIAISVFSLLNKEDLKKMYVKGSNGKWNLLSLIFIIPVFTIIFLPNLNLLKPTIWNVLNVILCIVNPFVE